MHMGMEEFHLDISYFCNSLWLCVCEWSRVVWVFAGGEGVCECVCVYGVSVCVCLLPLYAFTFRDTQTNTNNLVTKRTWTPITKKKNIHINIIIERCFKQKIFYATLLRYRAAVATFLKLISLLDTETRRVCAVASLITLMRILEETLKPLSHDSG